MNNNQHKVEQDDICNDCWAKNIRIMFCKKCHRKVFYLTDAKCDDCDNEAEYIQCGNCGFSNKFKNGYEAMEHFC